MVHKRALCQPNLVLHLAAAASGRLHPPAQHLGRATAAIDEGISCGASQAPLTRQTMHLAARTRVPMNNSKGAAFYASGNIAGEALSAWIAFSCYVPWDN